MIERLWMHYLRNWTKNDMSMKVKKNLLIKLHVYVGLFTFVYLLAFGFSSLVLNHKWQVEKKEVTNSWETQVEIDAKLPDLELAEQVRDNLGLMGWLPRWEFNRDSTDFRFGITHVAKDYKLHVELASGKVAIDEIPKGFWHVFHSLHFFNGKLPNAPLFVRTWLVYQWLTMIVMVISLILGLWLWWKYSYEPWHIYLFGGISLLSILLMLAL